MIEGLKPYPEYKESGSRWIGSVPSSWTIRNLRTLISHRSERNRPDLPLLSVAREKGVFVRSLTDANENHNFIPDDLTNYKVARAGDLVINKMKAWQGSMGIAPCDGIVSPAYFVFDFRIANHAFGQALLRSKPYVAHFGQTSDGVRVGQWDLSIPGMRQIPVLVPGENEQAAIVRFLDYASQKINRFIRTKRRIIELLNEKKLVIIHRAVTCGIDPNVRLKPSGIDWLGEVPEHWEIMPLKRVSRIIDGDRGSEYPTIEDFVPQGIPFLSSKSIKGGRLTFQTSPFISQEKFQKLREGKLRPGDVVITVRGTIGNSAFFGGDLYDTAFINAQMMILRPISGRILPAYLLQLTQSKYFKELLAFRAYGAAQQQLTNQILSVLPLPIPPPEQQKSILSALAASLRSPDEVIARTEHEIALLREYRTRLISDVVTGKLDVRGVELPAMDEAKALGDIDFCENTEDEAEELIESEGVADADE